MSISATRMGQYAKFILDDEECWREVAYGMSVQFWKEFREGDLEARNKAADKQDCLEQFLKELRINLANMDNMISEQNE